MATKGAGRFDYVRYDDLAQKVQADFKQAVEALEAQIDSGLMPGRAKALAMTKLEEVYMWIGKAIRDEQVDRNGSAPLQDERGKE